MIDHFRPLTQIWKIFEFFERKSGSWLALGGNENRTSLNLTYENFFRIFKSEIYQLNFKLDILIYKSNKKFQEFSKLFNNILRKRKSLTKVKMFDFEFERPKNLDIKDISVIKIGSAPISSVC